MLSEKRSLLAQLLESESKEESKSGIHNNSTPSEKISLYHNLFQGRPDVYAKRFESKKTGKSGYQPVCSNEWVRGICEKPRIKCADCNHKSYLPFNDEVIKNHLLGNIIAGVYPMLQNEQCWFLAVDFDKENWQQDATAFLNTCERENIPAYLERSRSGNGGHIWIFFEEPIYARKARNLGAALMTKTLDNRPELGLESFDRFFPNQDTMPHGGFGNIIALPLQKQAREQNHSVFIDSNFEPYPDQWAFLDSIEQVSTLQVEEFVQKAFLHKELLPVSREFEEIDEDSKPWERPKTKYPTIEATLPKYLTVVLSNQLFIPSSGLPAILRNRILRLASFSNPEFYQAQAMRLPTWNKPRILCCYEQFPEHIGLPVGCLDDLKDLLGHYDIEMRLEDKRNRGELLEAEFKGVLYPEQQLAFEALLKNEFGILSATTAFGKTVMALAMIAERKVNTLILVHRKQLMDQWVERIVQFLGIPKKEIGRFGGGRKKRNGLLDIAVLQSVSYKGEIQDWVGDYGQVIVDECHHISAFSFEQVLRKTNAFYRLGLSATLTRKDGQHPIVFMNLGPVRYKVSARKQAAERSFEHKVHPQYTDFEINDPLNASKKIQDVFRELWNDHRRNNMIVSDIMKAYQNKRQILVLSERTEHLEYFREQLSEHAENLFVLKGGLGKKQLKKIMVELEGIPSEEPRILLATGRYLGEGFDLPILDTLFMTFPVSWKGTLAQYAGRLHREFHSKTEVRILDYVDRRVPVLERMYQKRLKGYFSLGYEVAKD